MKRFFTPLQHKWCYIKIWLYLFGFMSVIGIIYLGYLLAILCMHESSIKINDDDINLCGLPSRKIVPTPLKEVVSCHTRWHPHTVIFPKLGIKNSNCLLRQRSYICLCFFTTSQTKTVFGVCARCCATEDTFVANSCKYYSWARRITLLQNCFHTMSTVVDTMHCGYSYLQNCGYCVPCHACFW